MVQALEGTRVADFSRQMSAPYATVLLGDYGADVVKVEALPHGDSSRRIGTAFVDGESALFLMWNRNKRSLAIDLRSPDSREIVRRLVEASDVLVENFRPGVTEAMGIGYEAMSELNPRLIYASLTAFGREGPMAGAPGTDPVVQAMSGVMSLTGEADGGPVLVGLPIADFTGAMMLTQGVLLGLLARDRTGCGQRVDTPMLAGLVFGLTTRLASYWADGNEPKRHGSAHSVVAPYQVYQASDGDVVAGAWAPEAWPRFCAAVQREDLIEDGRFATNADRVENREQLNVILKEIFAEQTTAEWEERFRAANALFAEVCSVPRILAHPQMDALGMVQEVEHARIGPIPQLGPPIFMSKTPGGIKGPPPVLGQHSAEVLGHLGYSTSEIEKFHATGVIHAPEIG